MMFILRLLHLRIVLVTICMCIFLAAPILAQPPTTADVVQSTGIDDKWPRLPDGRSVMDIYGVRLAIPECAHCLQTFEFWGEQGRGHVTFSDAVAQPAKLRALINAGKAVTLHMTNSWIPKINHGSFLGKFDPLSIPPTPRIDITISFSNDTQECWLIPRNFLCKFLHDTSTQHDTDNVDGLYILPGRINYPDDAFKANYGQSINMQKNEFLIVADDIHGNDAVGLPIRMFCDTFQTCKSSQRNGPPSFAMRPNVDLYFEAGLAQYSIPELIAAHKRLVEDLQYILIDANESKPK